MRITRIAAGISQARATYMPPDQLPDEAMWSYYAELCGGFDVYEQVMDASLGMSRRTAARTLNREPSKHRSTLTCAKSLAESAGRDRGVYFVRFADSKESKEKETPKEDKYKSRHSKSDKKEYQREHNVALFNLDVKELPGTIAQFRTSSDVANLSHIRCLLKWKDEPDKECKPRARTVANLPDNDLWIIGSGNGIKQFGNEYAPDGSNSSVRVNDLSELTQQLGNYELITVAAAELFSSSDVTFRKVDSVMYGEDEAKELQKTVREQAEVFGRGRRNLLGDSSFRLIIIADSDGSAKDIHNALQNYHGKLKTKLAKKKRRTLDKDTPQQVREFLLVKHRMALRALEQAELSRQDRRIVYAATQESKTTELKAQETYTKWRLEKSALTVKILLALAQGEAPKEEDIREVGGEKLVAEMQVEKALAKLDWPDSAYPFHDNKDIYIPTGGNYKPKYDSGKFIHRYRYKKSKRVLEKAFRALSKARGWKFMEHDGELYMDKGSERVKVRLEEESWNSSTLTLISQ